MPCSDSSSSITLQIDPHEIFLNFDFAKITCGQEITAQTGYAQYCYGKKLEEILNITYQQLEKDLNIITEEKKFILYLEWDSLRSAITHYLGKENLEVDSERCHITSIEHNEEGVEVALVMLPPKELPKIISCGKSDI